MSTKDQCIHSKTNVQKAYITIQSQGGGGQSGPNGPLALIKKCSAWRRQSPILKGHMINRILHSWSLHIKFMKVAEGWFF